MNTLLLITRLFVKHANTKEVENLTDTCHECNTTLEQIEHPMIGYTIVCHTCGYSRLIIVEGL